MTAHDLICALVVVSSIGHQVELPMLLEMDNKGAVNLANNWSVGGRTRHMDVPNNFLRDLKGEGLLIVRHVPGKRTTWTFSRRM